MSAENRRDRFTVQLFRGINGQHFTHLSSVRNVGDQSVVEYFDKDYNRMANIFIFVSVSD